MSRYIYSLFLYLLAPFLLLWMALRARRAGGQWQVFGANRFGRGYKQKKEPQLIWIHAVSLGETRAAQPLIRALLDQGHKLLISHLTATGWGEANRVYAADIAAGNLQQVWLPYDFPHTVKRFIRYFKPTIAILIEREIWPNLVINLQRQNIPIILASARMSEASLRRTLRFSGLLRPCYGALTSVYAQTLKDAQRLELAGAKNVSVSGNFKFDIQVDQEKLLRGRNFAKLSNRKIIAIASTREGEDELFIKAIDYQLDRMDKLGINPESIPLFFLIPRHPERFESAKQLLNSYGLNYVSRSAMIDVGGESSSAVKLCKNTHILLGDSMGEMTWYYGASDVAIVGGSFVPLGGQNFIEASALGCPVIVGPYTANFEQAVFDAIKAGAVVRSSDAMAAIKQALDWLDNCKLRRQFSTRAKHWVGQHTGAVARVMNGIDELL